MIEHQHTENLAAAPKYEPPLEQQDRCPNPYRNSHCGAPSINIVRNTNTSLGVITETHLCGNGHNWQKQWLAPSWGRA